MEDKLIEVACPKCRCVLDVPREKAEYEAGYMVACPAPECGEVFRVPLSETSEDSLPAPSPPPDENPPRLSLRNASARTQRVIRWTILAIVLCCLFPPWVSTYQEPGISRAETSAGYSPIFMPPTSDRSLRHGYGLRIDTARLAIQCLVILFLAGSVILLPARETRRPKRALEKPSRKLIYGFFASWILLGFAAFIGGVFSGRIEGTRQGYKRGYERGLAMGYDDGSRKGDVTVPSLLSPEPGTVLDNGRTDMRDHEIWRFEWRPVRNARAYNLHVMHPEAKKPVIDVEVLGTSYEKRAQCYAVKLHGWEWRVRAKIENTWGNWSEKRVFDVEPADTDLPSCKPPESPVDDILRRIDLTKSNQTQRTTERRTGIQRFERYLVEPQLQAQANWGKLRVGMTKTEVEDLLGKPWCIKNYGESGEAWLYLVSFEGVDLRVSISKEGKVEEWLPR